jgi:outer membrane receptor protein involved in Fe transport
LAVNHSVRLTDAITLSDGLPKLDLLRGSAIGTRPSGRHLVAGRANLQTRALGASIEGRWQSGSRLDGGATSLRFSDLATINLAVFRDLGGAPTAAKRWTNGLRLSLAVDNLFNRRMRVTDAAGATPLAYQAAYLDPVGRTVQLALRKQF